MVPAVAFCLALNCGDTVAEELFTTFTLLLSAVAEPFAGVSVLVFEGFCETLAVFDCTAIEDPLAGSADWTFPSVLVLYIGAALDILSGCLVELFGVFASCARDATTKQKINAVSSEILRTIVRIFISVVFFENWEKRYLKSKYLYAKKSVYFNIQ